LKNEFKPLKINKMKNQLSKKLSAFITTAMLLAASAHAQIVYTDVNPDVSDTCTSFNSNQPCNKLDSFDLNNDGVFDITLALSASISTQLTSPPPQSGFVRAYPLHGIAIKTDTLGRALSMNLNDVIDTNGSWMTTGQLTLIARRQGGAGPSPFPGNWPSGTDKYLGLKIVSGGQTNYCWVRLNVAVVLGTLGGNNYPVASFTIKDYAYNSIPNEALLAGQTQSNIGTTENSFASTINLFPNPATSHVTIDLGNNNQKVEVTITDVAGKIIYSIPIAIGTSETQKIDVSTQNFKAGIYVVQIQTADFIATKKLVIEK